MPRHHDSGGFTMIRRFLIPALTAGVVIVISVASSNAATRPAFTHGPTIAPAVATNPWKTIRSLPAPRFRLGAVTIGKTIYLGGGLNQSGADVSTFWAYSPAANTYTTKAPLPLPMTAVLLGSGGRVYALASSTDTAFHAYRYTPSTNSWQALGSLANSADAPFEEYAVGASGRIYGIGGSTDTTEVYTPSSNTWATLAHTASPDPTAKTSIGLTWNSSTGQITPPPTATNAEPPLRYGYTEIVGPDGRFYVIGGCDGPDEGDMECYPMNEAAVLDPSTHRWGVTGRISPLGEGFSQASNWVAPALANGKIFVFGGEDDFLTPASDAAAAFTPSDTTRPVVTQAPFAQPGTLAATRFGAPNSITLTFTSTDANGISDMQLQRRTNGGVWTNVPADAPYIVSNNGWFFANGTFTQIAGQAGKTYQYRVLASDTYGNTSTFKAGPSWQGPVLHQDAQATYTGSWAVTSAAGDSGGSLHQSTQNGAAAVFTFTGKGIGVMSPDVPGSLTVSVDGGPPQTFSEHQFQAKTDVVWALGFAVSGTHTIRFVHTGTAKVTIDAFKVIA
jgi:hypothetical protein